MRPALLLLSAAALAALPAALADEIKLKTGRSISDVEVVNESYESITYKIQGSVQEEPAGNVVEVTYARQPIGFAEAQKAFERGEYARVIPDLERLRTVREQWAKQYVEFWLAEAKRATGDGAGATEEYGRLLKDFPKTRFYLKAKIGLGSLKLAAKDYAGAQKIFEDLVAEAKAKKLGDDAADEASFRLAQVLEMQGKAREAADRYDRVAQAADARGGSHAGALAKIAAARLKAAADASKADAALSTIENLLDGLDPSRLKPGAQPDWEALAAAWNAIGEVHEKKGDYQKALLAYLRVALDPDLSKVASERPRALYGAIVAFQKTKGQDWQQRAESLKRELQEQYPNSPWAKR
jgi:tetratricopeptide (TPR) repeat protein